MDNFFRLNKIEANMLKNTIDTELDRIIENRLTLEEKKVLETREIWDVELWNKMRDIKTWLQDGFERYERWYANLLSYSDLIEKPTENLTGMEKIKQERINEFVEEMWLQELEKFRRVNTKLTG